MIRISLIIATYNRSHALLEALRSVVEQRLESSAWECIVVNNRSTDDTAEAFERFAARHSEFNLRLLYEPEQGLSAARNCGIRAARGEIIAIIDDDERINPDFLKAYLDLFEAHPACNAAGGRVIAAYEEEPRPRWMSPFTEEPIANPMHWGEEICPFPKGRIPAGGNMAFRRSIFEQYGLFNPALGRKGESLIGGEESDLFARLRSHHEELLYTPNATIWHLIPARKLSLGYLRQLAFQIGRTQRSRSELGGSTTRLKLFEIGKWGATLLIALFYLLSIRPQKANALILMRGGISRGIFCK